METRCVQFVGFILPWEVWDGLDHAVQGTE